jgi:hypothetical protein
MRKSFKNVVYAALAVLVFSSGAIAQSEIEPPSDPATPGAESAPAPEEPAADPAPEESITPDSESPAESSPNTGGAEPSPSSGGAAPAAASGDNSLVACGPNGAAFVVQNVSPGCRVLKVNSPPGQATNAADPGA